MILEEIKGGSLLAPVPDDHGGASDNLPLVTLGVQLAKASVLAELHVVWHSQEEHFMFWTKNLLFNFGEIFEKFWTRASKNSSNHDCASLQQLTKECRIKYLQS